MTPTSEKPLTKSQLIAQIADATMLKKPQVAEVLDVLTTIAYREAKKSEKGFTLPGFGKLLLVDRPERMGRNPSTGETIKIPAKKVVKFRLAKSTKDSLL
jgi:DNA-binding protein HU-beta